MKYFYSIAGLSVLGLSIPSSFLNSCIDNQSNRNFINKSLKQIVPINLSGDVPLITGIDADYCLSASIDMVFRFFNLTVDQDSIFANVARNINIAANYMNSELGSRIPNSNRFSITTMPENFGSTDNERILFQQYVTQSIGQNMPVIFGYFDCPSQSQAGHAIVITAVDIDTNDSNNTRYTVNDPNGPQRRFIFGRDLRNIIQRTSAVIGAANNFDFFNRKIKISFNAEKWSGQIHGEHTLATPRVDLTEKAGILNPDMLHKAKNLVLSDFVEDVYYNGWSRHFSQDTWQASNITIDNKPWTYDSSKSVNEGTLEFYFYYAYHSWIYKYSNHFVLELQYKAIVSNIFYNYPVLNFSDGNFYYICYDK